MVTGEFIAICEGDDYWIEKDKLEKQVSSMQDNPQLDLSFHPAYAENNGRRRPICNYSKNAMIVPASTVVFKKGDFMPTQSLVVRRQVFEDIHHYHSLHGPTVVGDYVIQVLGSARGGALFVPTIASVYRQGHAGSWSSRLRTDIDHYVRWLIGSIYMYNTLDKHTGYLYSEQFAERTYERLAEGLLGNRLSLRKKLRVIFSVKPHQSLRLIPLFAQSLLPRSATQSDNAPIRLARRWILSLQSLFK